MWSIPDVPKLRFVALVLLGFLMAGLFTGDYARHQNPTYQWWITVGNTLGLGLVVIGCCVLKKGKRLFGLTRWGWLAWTTVIWLIGFVLGLWVLNLIHH